MILIYAKLAGLMHEIEYTEGEGYNFTFDGPSSVFTKTRRYGLAMARFIPGLLACKGWKLEADILVNSRTMRLILSAEDGLSSRAAAPKRYDSVAERTFAERWGTEPREGWCLEREADILRSGQHCFFPDFVFVHRDGRRVLMEIVAFWEDDYLQRKRRNLELFSGKAIFLAMNVKNPEPFREIGIPILEFQKTINVEEVLELLRKAF